MKRNRTFFTNRLSTGQVILTGLIAIGLCMAGPATARMNLSGSAGDIQDFLDMLEECSCKELGLDMNGGVVILGSADTAPIDSTEHPEIWENASETSMELICDVIESDTPIDINVGRDQPRVVGDAFGGDGSGTVDVGDLDEFPASPPSNSANCSTRCQKIVHFLAEYRRAATNGIPANNARNTRRDFNDAHQVGIDAENQHRQDIGQTTSTVTARFRTRTSGAFVYSDGTAEILHFPGGNISAIEWP